MRYVKPQSAAVLTRPFEYQGRFHLGVSVLLFSTLEASPRLLTEQALWAFWAEQPEAGAPLEEGIPRAWSEYLIGATAHPPDPPQPACRVVAEVGALRKELVVWGERHWSGGRISTPEPFDGLRLDWSLAFGGPDFPENPAGCAHTAGPTRPGEGPAIRLPRVEYPDAPWAGPETPVRPAGFGPLDVLHPQRAARRGTYDRRWFEHHYPGLAPDIDWRFFNRALDDQQQPVPFRGDEAYRFIHMHPRKPRLEGRLPGLAARAFATRAGAPTQMEEVTLQLMALWFFPAEERLIQVFQGALAVAEDDASDIVHLLVAVERLGARRPQRHYRHVRDKRLDPDKGLLESLRESDLAPEDLVVPLFDPAAGRDGDIAYRRAQQRARKERAALRKMVEELGLDPEAHAPPVEGAPPPEIRSLDDLLRLSEQMQHRLEALPAQADREKKKLMEEIAPLLDGEGLDVARWRAQMEGQEGPPPPAPFAEHTRRQLLSLADTQPEGSAARSDLLKIAGDPDRQAHWKRGEEAQADGYRAASHTMPPPPRRSSERSAALRKEVADRLSRAESLAGMDLSAADLAGMDLSGADLRGAFLNGADLSSANLAGADLRGATLAHARLIGTQLAKAELRGANLGKARIEGADFSDADLREAVFDGARLRHATLARARLDGSRWLETEIQRLDLSGTLATEMLVFQQLDLTGCRLQGARWDQILFLECTLRGADLRGARFGKAVFQAVDLSEADLSNLRIERGCLVQGCRLSGARLRGAWMREVSLRGADLSRCDLREATLTSCDLSGCDLRAAQFHGADLRGALLNRARLEGADLYGCNLMEANLQHARLAETDFRFSNLHASDWARVHLGPGVRTDGALSSRVRTHPRRRPEPAA